MNILETCHFSHFRFRYMKQTFYAMKLVVFRLFEEEKGNGNLNFGIIPRI